MINSIRIPPLRERPGDIPLLAELFLKEEVERAGKNDHRILARSAWSSSRQYSYPDNVQELITIVAGAVANAETDTITVESLPLLHQGTDRAGGGAEMFMPKKLDEVVREHVRLTLAYFGQQREAAAEVLGITPAELDRIIAEDLSEE